ncbi:YcxB family protein [Lacrimispora xylanisolvens]|uniref:YcxB family protein n=1 Tax=Lacrimispora xylanisolvens TaxID=384636 RepID=UPI002402C674
MLLEFTYTKKEYADGWRKFFFLTKVIKKFDLVIMAFSLLIPFYLFYQYGFTRFYIMLALVIYFFNLVIVAVFFIRPYMFYQEYEQLHHPYKLLFEDDKITFDAHGIHSTLSWDIYKHYMENKDYFYIIQKKRTYTLIPKRIFASENEISAFRQLLTNHLTTP